MIDQKTLDLLHITQEECAEVIQIISKINRFGFDSFNPYDPEKKTNIEMFHEEMGDLICLYEIMINRGILDQAVVESFAQKKLKKLKQFSSILDD